MVEQQGWRVRVGGWVCLVMATVLAGGAIAADQPDYSAELPRIPPGTPAEALKAFAIVDSFHVELAAAEPVVADPVAVSFDENGRLFVVEMRGYSEQDKENRGLIALLEDTDGDGRFDTRHVYADKLSWPTAVICWDGGVFVAAAPDIWYFKDTDGDHKADIRQRVFTGFGKSNVQGLLNSFRWGLDNRIHGATSSSGGNVRRVINHWPIDNKAGARPSPQASNLKPQAPVSLRGRDFAFDPRTLALAATAGGAQHGMSFDDWGRKFVCSNSDHLQMVMFESSYLARNPYLAAPRARKSIAADGGQAPVYRISPVEPWRIVRTRLRVAGKVRGPVEGGGKPAGYFTGSTGVTIYRGDAWPARYRGLAFIGDVGSNIVHRKTLVPDGVGFIGKRIDQQREFLASTDIWFRPVQFANAPDGNLYVLDMCREVIEHPHSLPPMIKKHLDLTSGRDRGRIWRVTATGHVLRASPRFGLATTPELVKLLAHPNAWHRETAARLLYQRQDAKAVGPLRKLVTGAPLGVVHALHALDGMNALDNATVLAALGNENPRVLEHAVRAAERVDIHTPAIIARLDALADHADMRVRYQVAFTLGQRRDAARLNPLLKLLRRDGGDPWMRLAVLSSLPPHTGDALTRLIDDATYRRNKANHAMLEQLATIAGRWNHPTQVAAALAAADRLADTDAALAKRLKAALQNALAKAVASARSDKSRPVATIAPPRSAIDTARFDKLVESYRPSLKLNGDAAKGKATFTKLCATCHKAGDAGHDIGPNLAAMRNRGADAILLNLLDPNREVNPQYINYVVTTKDGEKLTGIIAAETVTSITLQRANNETSTVLRVDIDTLRSTGMSLMPEELQKGMDQQAVADLLAFLLQGQ